MGLFDELVQNEVNRVHNEYAQAYDELPVQSRNVLMEDAGNPNAIEEDELTQEAHAVLAVAAQRIDELKQFSPGEARNIAHEMETVSKQLGAAVAKRGGPDKGRVGDLVDDMRKLLKNLERHATMKEAKGFKSERDVLMAIHGLGFTKTQEKLVAKAIVKGSVTPKGKRETTAYGRLVKGNWLTDDGRPTDGLMSFARYWGGSISTSLAKKVAAGQVKTIYVDEGEGLDAVVDQLAEATGGDKYEVARTILAQFGGRKAMMMIGGKAVLGKDSLTIRWPNRQRSKGNAVKITLRGDDTYDMEFLNVAGSKVKTVKKHSGVYADQLQDLFEKQTGWYLRM